MRRVFALTMTVGLLVALVSSGTALARAEFTEFTGTETQIGGGPIFDDVDWTDPVIHADLESIFNDVTTDPRTTGTTYASGKLTLTDPATFTGTMHGTFVTFVSGNGYEGTWEGTWQGKIVNGISQFTAVGHGSGDLEGLQEKVTFTGSESGLIYLEGRILDPHGG